MPAVKNERVAYQDSRERQVLTSAILNAAKLLDLPQAQLAKVIGVSAPTVSRMRNGNYQLDQQRKEWSFAILFVRLFRSLDSMTAGRENDARAWLHSVNHALNGMRPVDLISDISGLVHVVDYLDAIRGRV